MANFEYGMLSQGFVPKRLVDINNDMLERVEAIQDPKTGEFPFANASGDTILTQLVGIFPTLCLSAGKRPMTPAYNSTRCTTPGQVRAALFS